MILNAIKVFLFRYAINFIVVDRIPLGFITTEAIYNSVPDHLAVNRDGLLHRGTWHRNPPLLPTENDRPSGIFRSHQLVVRLDETNYRRRHHPTY